MTASKFCPYPGCTNKIQKTASFCRKHMIHNGKPPLTNRTIQCAICNQPFDTTNPRQKYCKECHETTCVICNKKFKRNFGKKPFVTTCSPSCTRKLGAKNSARKRKALNCQWCGIEFFPENGHLNTKFCCKEHKCLASRKEDTDKRRNSYKYIQWRENVYKRDNYTCQQCGETGKIQAHHIKEWKDHKELRYDVDNGITLCRTCHENIHGASIPRVAKRFPPHCASCGKETKGRASLCKSCSMKQSAKAKKQRISLTRDENGQFVSSSVEPV